MLLLFREQSSNSGSRRTEGQRGRHSNSRARRTDPSSTAAAGTHMGHSAKVKGLKVKETQEKQKHMV